MNKLEALQTAIELAGGQSALAMKLTTLARQSGLIKKNKTVSQQSVNSWVNRHKRSPTKFVFLIAAAINQEVTANQLRPDLYPQVSECDYKEAC
jgi:DNA-binding transcriptional regulator YdaS (Cro superfamily)